MELSKYNSLVDKINGREIVNAIYVNFFGEDSAYIYPIKVIHKGLKDGSIKTVEKWCPVTTAANNGWKVKQIIEIPRELGWRYELKDNQWIKTN